MRSNGTKDSGDLTARPSTNMNAGFRFLLAFSLLGATPVFAAKHTGKPSTPMPSVQLRHMIDTTMAKIADITNPKRTFNRTPLTEAQADFTAKALTATPAQQPMYQAAQNVIANLVGAVEEHEKAVANFQYSKNLHGPQDRQNEDITNARRAGNGWANNAKQNKENADSRAALLDKEKFLSNGTIATWSQRVGQIHDAVEQAYASELVAEKQLAMLTPPAPTPAPKAAPKTKEPSAADQYSPVGAWRPDNSGPRRFKINEDNTATGGMHSEFSGTWKWTDQPKRAMTINWVDGLSMDLNFSPDGHTLTGKSSRGLTLIYNRGN